MRLQSRFEGRCRVGLKGVRSGESSIEQRPDTRICVVQRISDRMKECEGDGCQRKSAAVEKECRTSGGQTDMTDHRCLQI